MRLYAYNWVGLTLLAVACTKTTFTETPPIVSAVNVSGQTISLQGDRLGDVSSVRIEGMDTDFQIASKSTTALTATALASMAFTIGNTYELLLQNGSASTPVTLTFDLADGSVTPEKLSKFYVPLAGGTMAGNLGIGMTPATPFAVSSTETGTVAYVASQPTNADGTLNTGIMVDNSFSRTATGAATNFGFWARNHTSRVAAGITDSGSSTGFYSEALRGTATDLGTFGTLQGGVFLHGHTNGVGASAVTTSSIGLLIRPYAMGGTVTSAYDLYLDNIISGGTLTNRWAIYQADTTTKSYFAGRVGIGNSAPGVPLDVTGDIRTSSCVLYSGGSSGACASDERFKKDISPIKGALEKIARLRPVHFNWRASDFPARNFSKAREAGLIAQDVEKVFPELVTVDKEGFKRVTYGAELEMEALQAIRELKEEKDSQIEALKKENGMIRAYLCAKDPTAAFCKPGR